MLRPRPNNKELQKCTQETHTSHSFTFTGHYSRQPEVSPTHIRSAPVLCRHMGGAFIHSVFVFVCRSPERDKLRAGCLSWEEGRVAVETAMPKPDLLCLVQLLDGTIETFSVNVCNTQTHATPSRSPSRSRVDLWFATDCFVPTLVSVTNGTFLYFPIDLTDSCSTVCPWLEGLPHFLQL